MSDPVALALVVATFFPGFFCFIYITKIINAVGMTVLTGLSDGIPISSTYRWLVLNQVWAPQVSAVVALGVVIALVNVQVGSAVISPGVRAAAYAAASLGGAGALSMLLSGPSAYLHYRSVLRQAEAD